MSTTAAVLDPAPPRDREGQSIGLPLIVSIIVLAAHAPLLFVHFEQLWLKPHYQLFPFVLAGSFALVWPLSKMTWQPAGLMRYAVLLMAAGIGLIVFGAVAEAGEWSIGAPTSWIGAGGVAMMASIPLLIFGGPNLAFISQSRPSGGKLWVTICCLMLAFAVFFGSAAFTYLSAVIVIASIPWTIGGRSLFRRCLPGIAYLLLILPPPFGLDSSLVIGMQVFAAKMASRLLDLMGVSHSLDGVTIDVGSGVPYGVEEACSGISSLLSVLACVLMYVLWTKMHWLRGTLLTLAAVFWVLVSNMIRIIAITFFGVGFTLPVFRSFIKFDLSTGLVHQLFGMFLFGFTLFMLWSTDRLLMFFGRSDPPKRRIDPLQSSEDLVARSTTAELGLSGTWYRSIPLALAFAGIATVQVAEWVSMASKVPYSGSALSRVYEQIETDLLPADQGKWKRPEKLIAERRNTGNPLGEFSRVWRYKNTTPNSKTECLISFDYPYPEYHDLRVCYTNTGWKVGEPSVFEYVPKDGGPPLKCVFVEMQKPNERYGYLWFCNFDQDGVSLEPDTIRLIDSNTAERLGSRFSYRMDRWKRLFAPTVTAASSGLGSVLQVQALHEAHRPLTEADREEIKTLFTTSAERLRAKCAELKTAKK